MREFVYPTWDRTRKSFYSITVGTGIWNDLFVHPMKNRIEISLDSFTKSSYKLILLMNYRVDWQSIPFGIEDLVLIGL